MRRVIIESPYQGTSKFPPLRWWQRYQNVRYARACMRDCLDRGEAPYASHLLFTQPGILRDRIPAERERGIDAGLWWGTVADLTAMYTDRGISGAMRYGLSNARCAGRTVEFRSLKSKTEASE